MTSLTRSLLVLVLLAGAGAAGYYLRKPSEPVSPEASAPLPSPSVSAIAAPAIHYPVPSDSSSEDSGDGAGNSSGAESSSPKPLPQLDESDETIEGALRKLFGSDRYAALFNPKNIVRRIVVTVDNSTGHLQPTEEFSPFKPLLTAFRAEHKEHDLYISADNFARYHPLIELVQVVDLRALTRTYFHFYPLFQSAYEDLGMKGYFNDRLVETIDVILKTPEVQMPISIVRGELGDKYKYSDDRIEALPAAQKLMIRMGNENAQIIKSRLKELRLSLTRFGK